MHESIKLSVELSKTQCSRIRTLKLIPVHFWTDEVVGKVNLLVEGQLLGERDDS
jgi:hypothetical protein